MVAASSHYCQQVLRAPFSPLPRQHLLPFVFLMTAALAGARENLNVVLIRISLLASGVEHFLMSAGNSKWIKSLHSSPKTLKLSEEKHRNHLKI